MVCEKLVRDKIPAIMEEKGKHANIRILSDAEYSVYLERKLDEEVVEFHKDKNLEELADILEVVYALAAAHGLSPEQLQALRQQKRRERGGFDDRIFLIRKERA